MPDENSIIDLNNFSDEKDSGNMTGATAPALRAAQDTGAAADSRSPDPRAAAPQTSDPRAADHVFIINPRSFQRKADMDAAIAGIENTLREFGNINYHIHISRYPRDAMGAVNRYARGMLAKRAIRVYAVGGDGILFDCLNAIMGLDGAELAIVPYGYENEFVRAFGEGADELFRDIKAQLAAASIPTDVIFCDGNYALNYCTIGLESASIVRRAEHIRRSRRLLNIFKALYKSIDNSSAFFSALYSNYNQRYNILAGGDRLDGAYTTIHIANGPCYGSTMTPTGDSAPDDGQLELVTGYARSSFARAKLLKAIGSGRYRSRRNKGNIDIQYRRAKELKISSDGPMIINLDGEIFYETAINIRIIPGGTRIIAPNGAKYIPRMDNKQV